MANVNDGMEGGADPGGVPGGGPDVPTGTANEGDQYPDPCGVAGGGGDLKPSADSSTAAQPRPEDFL